ncbi:type I-C CRISPR-associated protein Cas5 [candidate division KSB1 bacterium]|nr:type I-C CRISPR-associated protein Cas5 [candidate division KSB1 bacterium]RQW04204.1 MAG: type I-C CRISPR-associated protein Cas5 [candidate division KSB1 bacterium]
MKYPNTVEFKVWGKYALFTDPLTKIGGEKYSYQIPTYEALKGILSSVYWKPTFIWVIDKVRVMKRIKTQTRSAKPIRYYSDANDLAIYTYLSDVEYQVQAHFEWNENRNDLAQDRNENKHYFVAKRMIERGGRRDVFLGTRECQGYVEECTFGEDEGYYDGYGEFDAFGLMFHGFDYPDEANKDEFWARFWRPKMQNGVIEFSHPEDKSLIRKFVRPMTAEPPTTSGFMEEGLLAGYEEGRI